MRLTAEETVRLAAVQRPFAGVELVPQRFIVEMIGRLRGKLRHAGSIPIGAPDDVLYPAQGFLLILPDAAVDCFLPDDIALHQVLQRVPVADVFRQISAIMLRVYGQKPLNGNYNPLAHPQVFRRINHGQRVLIFRAPEVNDIRLLFAQDFLQLSGIGFPAALRRACGVDQPVIAVAVHFARQRFRRVKHIRQRHVRQLRQPPRQPDQPAHDIHRGKRFFSAMAGRIIFPIHMIFTLQPLLSLCAVRHGYSAAPRVRKSRSFSRSCACDWQ